MTLDEAKKVMKEIRKRLVADDLVIADGRDENDSQQNEAFSISYKALEDFQSSLAMIDIDGVDCDKLWKNAWGKNHQHLPEDMYSHAVTYIDSILEL